MELRGVEPRVKLSKSIGIKQLYTVRVYFRVHFKHNTAEAGRLIPTSAVLLHLAALLCRYSTAQLICRQVLSPLRLLSEQRAPCIGAADAVRLQAISRLTSLNGRHGRRAADTVRAVAAALIALRD